MRPEMARGLDLGDGLGMIEGDAPVDQAIPAYVFFGDHKLQK